MESPQPPARARWRRLASVLTAAVLVLAAGSLAGCKNRRRDRTPTLGDLNPPRDAPDWESRYAVAFDDSYTPTSLNLQGRAPNDVLDQQLFQARLGHAALVLLVRVEQVWGRGRYQGRQKQFVEVLVGEILLGSLPKDSPDRLMVEIESIDELPGALKGEIMLLFVRWAPESEPPYHHHLMPADDDVVALIKAMVEHAKAEGVLDKQGEETGGKRGKGKRGKRGKGRGGKKKDKRGGGPVEPVDDSNPGGSSGTPTTYESGGVDSDPIDADYQPPSVQPEDSTGLQDLGGEPKVEESASGDAPP